MSLDDRLARHGLFVRGVATISAAEIDEYGLDPELNRLALIGNIGSSYWDDFSASPEFADGRPDPLDRWSRRIAEVVAAEFELRALYPFEGPPYFPFQRWANRAEGLAASPLGVLIHPEYGVWHSYRFALLAREIDTAWRAPEGESPCLTCVDQPCLRRCPVEAYSTTGFAVDTCAGYLADTPDASCREAGCEARHACPVAPQHAYRPAQSVFHLRAFLDARW